jgi:hypothetical protein
MVTATVDKATISTELNTSSQLKVSVTGMNFSGQVTLDGKVVDANSQPITGWTLTWDTTSLSFSADGTQVATATLKIPSQNMGALAATVQLTATCSVGMVPLSTAVTVANQVSFVVNESGGACGYPTGINQAAPAVVAVGTKVRFLNMTTQTIVIHSNGGNDGINHQDLAGMPPNGIYEQTLSGTGTPQFSWYCHSPGPDLNNNDPFIKAVQ